MRLIHSAAAAASLLSVVIADCTHDNCLRAVLGVSYPTRSGLADCNSYLQTTVTPATSTVTVTATESTTTPKTVTETVGATGTDIVTSDTTTTISQTVYNPQAKRQVTATPTFVPPYAYTACHSDVASYTAACFCIGATANTIYAPTPIVTVTVSTTSVATSTQTNTATTTSTTLTTLTRTSTSVFTIETACPEPASVASCPQIINSYPDGVVVYNNIISTSCKLPPTGYDMSLNIPGDAADPCEAATDCLLTWKGDEFLYGIAIYYSRSAGEFICVGYDGISIDAGQFSEFDGDVVEVYGFKNS